MLDQIQERNQAERAPFQDFYNDYSVLMDEVCELKIGGKFQFDPSRQSRMSLMSTTNGMDDFSSIGNETLLISAAKDKKLIEELREQVLE